MEHVAVGFPEGNPDGGPPAPWGHSEEVMTLPVEGVTEQEA